MITIITIISWLRCIISVVWTVSSDRTAKDQSRASIDEKAKNSDNIRHKARRPRIYRFQNSCSEPSALSPLSDSYQPCQPKIHLIRPLKTLYVPCISLSLHFIPMHFHIPRVQSFTNIVDQVRDAMKHYRHEKESEAHQVCIFPWSFRCRTLNSCMPDLSPSRWPSA